MSNTWGVSPLGIDFLKKQEGYRPEAYNDYKQWSSGWGTRSAPGEVIDKAEAERRLLAETGKVSNWLKSNVTAPLTDQQEDALISAGYNLGTGEKGLGRLLGDINAGSWDRVGQRLNTFINAGGKPNEGLINRRAAEVEMLTGRKPSAYIGGTAEAPAQTGGQPMPPQQALVPPSGRYSRLADMLLASGAGAKPRGWGELLNAGGDLALGYSLSNKDEQAQNQYRSKLAEALGGAGDRDALVNTLMQSGNPEYMNMAIAEKLKPPPAPEKPQTGRYKAVEGGGVLDTATGEYVVPPPSGEATGGLSPIAEKEKQKALGKAQGESIAGLPVALQSGEALVSGIDDLLEDPKLPSMTGPFDSLLPNLSGNAARVQSKLDKVQGQTFLQAYEKLKGGGVITEIEGEKAESALNRLKSLDQNDADYVDALIEFRNEVATLYDIAQERAGVPPDQRKTIPPLDRQQTTQQQQPKSEPPAPAVQFLQQNPSPEIIEQFNQKYGPGAAERILSNQPSMTGVSP